MVEDNDPVTVGIREWQRVKQAAEDAIERARKAEEDVAYYRGQCELMQHQRKLDETNMRRLQQHCDEMSIMVDSLGAAVLSVVEKRKAGFFRRAGSVAEGAERIRAATANSADLDENLRELARGLVNKRTEPPTVNVQ
jgi:hypothetical protein